MDGGGDKAELEVILFVQYFENCVNWELRKLQEFSVRELYGLFNETC